MKEFSNTLELNGKPVLASIIKNDFSRSIFDYSKNLMSHTPSGDIEPELIESLQEEMEERKYSKETIESTTKELKENRILQTSPHTSLAPNQRMFCIDWLSTQGLEKDRPYIVGSFSGVPFSNSTKPGRIEMNESVYNFIPKTHQDALVYESNIFEKTNEVFEKLQNENGEGPTLPINPEGFERFSDWACSNSQKIHEKALEKEIVYLDINKIITRYILKILDKENHPIHKLLFDKSWREKFDEHFGSNIHLFYGSYKSKKYQKQESLYFDGYDLSGDYHQINLSPENLREKLLDNSLCPATVLTFTILSFLNDFKCLGSFMQVEYLTDFKNKWQECGLIGEVEHVQTKNLSTGQFPNFHGTAIDFLTNEPALPDPKTSTMEELWNPMKDLFIK